MERVEIMEWVIAAGVLAPSLYFDLREQRIPDAFTLSGLAALLVGRLLAGRFSVWDPVVAAIGFAAIAAFWFFSGGSIGLGDAKLSAFLALWLGLWGWAWALLLASLSGVLFALAMMALGRMSGRERLPFAPFLFIGAALSFGTRDLVFGWIVCAF